MNCKGAVAISFDDGETIYLPTGRVIDRTDMWEEANENLEDQLNEFQTKGLARFRKRQTSDHAGENELASIVRSYREERIAEERFYEPAPVQYRKLPDSVKVIVADFD